MIRAKTTWHKQAKQFLKDIQQEYTFADDETGIIFATCDQLSMYWKAADQLEKEGLTVVSGNMSRKNPLCEVVKNSWAGFLAGCRLLDIGGPEQVKNRIGRPDGVSS